MPDTEYEWSDEHARIVFTLGAPEELRPYRAGYFDEWLRRHDERVKAGE